MTADIAMLAFDADDTLWENEGLFLDAQASLRALLSRYHAPEWIDARLFETETRNMAHYGYGIKAFTLSMIETAIELSEGRISAGEIMQIIGFARRMLDSEVQLLPDALDTLRALHGRVPMMVITKGDLRDQHDKLERSGLAGYFEHVEVVANKREADYARILRRHAVAPQRFMMVGNSLKSDVLPLLALGARAVWVPHALTWAHEHAEPPPSATPGYAELRSLRDLLPMFAAGAR